ncbi:MAG: restriction endonuclease subunit S [Shimia sp.]
MELRPGYKYTEIGVIPENWKVVQLRDYFHITAGGDVDRNRTRETQDGRFQYPIYANAITGKGLYGFASYSTCPANSITVTARGELGHAEFRDRAFTAIGRLLVLVPTGEADPSFVASYLNERVVFAIESTGVPQLTAPQIGRYQIALPPAAEQRAIAEALLDIDISIARLVELIAKKRELRTGAMQRLVTGKTRLPGFSSPWEEKMLREIGRTYGGLTGKTKTDFGLGQARYVTFMGVVGASIIEPSSFDLVRIRPTEKQNCVLKGDILFNGSSETPEEVALCAFMDEDHAELYLNSFCFGFRLIDSREQDGRFLVHYLRCDAGRRLVKELAQGSTRYNISKKALMKIAIPMPEKAEQVAIVKTIEVFDLEIATLKTRLEKTRALKQGMMQALLTGRVRLPVQAEALDALEVAHA